MGSILDSVHKEGKNIKREILFMDIALLVLGVLLMFFPEQSRDIICRVSGALLCLWGLPSAAAFRWQDMMNFQIQLTRRNDTLPMTRNYMEKCEKALTLHEMGHQPKVAKVRPKREPKPKRRPKHAE